MCGIEPRNKEVHKQLLVSPSMNSDKKTEENLHCTNVIGEELSYIKLSTSCEPLTV